MLTISEYSDGGSWLEIDSQSESTGVSNKVLKFLDQADFDSFVANYYRVCSKEQDAVSVILYQGNKPVFKISADRVPFVESVRLVLDVRKDLEISSSGRKLFMSLSQELRNAICMLAMTWDIEIDEFLKYVK